MNTSREEHQLKVCVVSGTRAEYGLLRPVIAALELNPSFRLQIVATGAHLSPEFGQTWQEIADDGFTIDERIEMLVSSDSGAGCAKSIGLGTIGFADAFVRLAPDLIMLLGDRFEALAAAQAALVMRIPVAHISGGHVTAGAFDDSIRHSITKMAHLHFVTSENAARRVRQLGEAPERVHMVGDPGLDELKTMQLIERRDLEKELDIQFRLRNLMVTFHPATLDPMPSAEQYKQLLDALDTLGDSVGIVLTKPNADPEGRALARMTDAFVAKHANTKAFTSLGRVRYLSVMAQADLVVGNSSSGLLEAPSLGKPTVNIGTRQQGRLRASSVVDCPANTKAILDAVAEAFRMDCNDTENPYGDGHASERIIDVLRQIPDPSALLKKQFYDLEVAR